MTTSIVDVAEDGLALVFASDSQLALLQSSAGVYFDGTFKVVPSIFLQLFTLFVTCFESASPVLFVLMSRKTQALYCAVFEKVKELAPDFHPTCAMSDFEEASTSAFKQVFGNLDISGCWFHYAQAIIKRVNKIGLKQPYLLNSEVKDVVRCLLGLPLLPAAHITVAADELRQRVTGGSAYANLLDQLLSYVQRQWIQKASIGPQRLTVREHVSRTNNILESFHASLKRRIQIPHPNFLVFMGHLQRVTSDAMSDVARLRNGLRVRRHCQKKNILKERRIAICIARFDAGNYTRLDFLRAVSHSMGAHTEALHYRGDNEANSDEEQRIEEPEVADAVIVSESPPPPTEEPQPIADACEICLLAPRVAVALVPCGHSRFCGTCADTVAAMSGHCPICRSDITMVMRLFT